MKTLTSNYIKNFLTSSLLMPAFMCGVSKHKVGIMKILTIIISLIIAGCSTATNASSKLATVDKSVQSSLSTEHKWIYLTEGAELSYDENYEHHPSEMKLSNERFLRGDNWNGYLKAYVETFKPEKRGQILDGLTRHVTEYDKVEGLIRYEPVRYMSGPYSKSSYVALIGTLGQGKGTSFIKFHYYGDSWVFAESLKIVTDGVQSQSLGLHFNRDNHRGKVWETTYLDLNKKENRALAERIVSSKEAIIRFQGKQYYSDLIVTDRMREDIGYMLKALDEIGGI